MAENRKPITDEEVLQILKTSEAEHEKQMASDPEYRALWKKREKSIERMGLFNDSIPE